MTARQAVVPAPESSVPPDPARATGVTAHVDDTAVVPSVVDPDLVPPPPPQPRPGPVPNGTGSGAPATGPARVGGNLVGPLNPPPPGVVRQVLAPPVPEAAPATPPRPESERRVILVGLTGLTFGLCLLLFLGYLFVFSGFQASRHQVTLLNTFRTPAGAAALSGRTPANGQPVGVLDIPAIHLQQVVVEGTTATDLLNGPGLMPGTARPGTRGNAVIAGRRATAGRPFADLDQLRVGSPIVVTTGLGRFHYRVDRVAVANVGSVDPVVASRSARLTLVTGNPQLMPTGFLYVVAHLTGKPAAGRFPRVPPSPSERGLSGDPGAVVPSILWGVALLVGLATSIWAYLRWRGRIWVVYLITTPIVLALALIWYEELIRLLPATM